MQIKNTSTPIRLILSATRKENDEDVTFFSDVEGDVADVLKCTICLVDALLKQSGTPTGVFIEALKIKASRTIDSN